MSAFEVSGRGKPGIGILGIMQDLYDDMIPGIAQRQEGYAAELAAHQGPRQLTRHATSAA